MNNVFIGYDAREDEAYRVCDHSIRVRTSSPLSIHPIKHRNMRQIGLFDRPWRVEENGQFIDARDGKPFSTEFSHTRFLTPHYAKWLSVDAHWVLFCDCDFLFLADVAELFNLADDRYAVMCVKHVHVPTENDKMDYGTAQTRYWRKNWSSLILWNLEHKANDALTLDNVNLKRGSWLHAFNWLPDDLIGELPAEWNWIDRVAPKDIIPKAVHYSLGGPWFDGHADVKYADLWLRERHAMQSGQVWMCKGAT